MSYQESSVKVFFTKEYKQFKFVKANREVSQVRVNKIKLDIESGIDVLSLFPILVKECHDGKLEIYDGQHRYFVAQELGRPVHFIIMPKERTMFEIAAINSNTAKWTIKDYMACYIEEKNNNYSEFNNFMQKYGFSSSLSMRLLVSGTPQGATGDAYEQFKRGLFEIKKLTEAVALAESIQLFDFFPYNKNSNFVVAIHKIKEYNKRKDSERVTIEDLAAKAEKNKEDLKKQDSISEYITNLEGIYNKSRQSRVILFK